MKWPLKQAIQSFLKNEENSGILKRQRFLFGLLILIGCGLFYFSFLKEEPTAPKKKAIKELKKVDIQSGGQRVDPEEVWRYKIEEKNEDLQKNLGELKNLINDQLKENNDKLDSEHTLLREKLLALEDKVEATRVMGNRDSSFKEEGEENLELASGGIQKITFVLQSPKFSHKNSKGIRKTIKDTLPAGSFAKAILLAGVDASTAMNAASDPRPMLLRITDMASLPRKFQSDLKDCRCTASTYGDISSERVHARLEKLICIRRKSGEIVETQVAGYIAGHDGREGIRGKVVSKDAAYLARGLVSGVLGGLSSIASPNKTSPTLTLGLGTSTVETPSKGDLFKSGVAGGGAHALDRLSSYYIDRAEQLQPVIQVPPGQYVDVIFTEGVSFGDLTIKEDLQKRRVQGEDHA